MGSIEEISQLCRLCLIKDQVNVPIFDETSDINETFVKINSCLPVKVSPDDNLPKKICDGCSYKLDMLYIFRNTSAESEQQLVAWLDEAGLASCGLPQTSIKESNTKSEILVKQEAFEATDPRVEDDTSDAHSYILQQQKLPYQQEFTFVEATASGSGLVSDEPPLKRPKRAAALKKISVESEDLEATMQITKAEDDDSDDADQPDYIEAPSTSADDQPGPSGVEKGTIDAPATSLLEKLIYGPSISITPVAGRIKATKKRRRTRTKKSLRKEELVVKVVDSSKDEMSSQEEQDSSSDNKPNDTTEAVHCDVCDVTYSNNVAYALHSIDHNTDNKYSCHLCDYRNASKYHIEMHIKAHEGTTKYKCEICQKAFTVSTHAIEHKYYHTGEKPFQCEICGKHFMFSWFLTSHRRTQHWEIMTGTPLVKYDCTICNKHYTSSTGLRRHNLSKHNVEGVDSSVLCDICGKRLSSKEKLKFHRRIHTGYKPYACEICTKSFSRKEQLKEHERVHTGEKPFICNFCGKGFTQRSPLRIHERTHTGERPYICRICGKGYISKGVMDTHMKSCTAIPMY